MIYFGLNERTTTPVNLYSLGYKNTQKVGESTQLTRISLSTELTKIAFKKKPGLYGTLFFFYQKMINW